MDFLVKPVINESTATSCSSKYCCYASGNLRVNDTSAQELNVADLKVSNLKVSDFKVPG